MCRDPEECPEKDHLFHPRDGKCYKKLTRGPCPKGELVTEEDGLAICSCSSELADNYWPNGSASGCFEHYTRGPCADHGDLFLPGGTCGCHSSLAHYHNETKTCYPIGKHDISLQNPHYQTLEPPSIFKLHSNSFKHSRWIRSLSTRPHFRPSRKPGPSQVRMQTRSRPLQGRHLL